MRLWFPLVLVLAALSFTACIGDEVSIEYGDDTPSDGDSDADGDLPGDGDNPADGDTPLDGDIPYDGDVPTDGDIPNDGDEPIDGDIPNDGDEPGWPCESSADCPRGLYCHPNTLQCVEDDGSFCDSDAECNQMLGRGCWSCSERHNQCIAWECAANADCCEGALCLAGACEYVGGCPHWSLEIMAQNTISTMTVNEGQIVQLRLMLRDESGQVLSDDLSSGGYVTWRSSDPEIVYVDGSGRITGGPLQGSATISAQLTYCSEIYDRITVRNVPYSPGLSRIIVMEDKTGRLLGDVNVRLGNGQTVTDAGGIATFDNVTCGTTDCRLDVWKSGYEPLTVLNVRVNDIIAPLKRAQPLTQVSAMTGSQDHSRIAQSYLHDVIVGFTGFAWSDWIDPAFSLWMRPEIRQQIIVGATIDEETKLPGGLEMLLNGSPVTTGYHIAAPGGNSLVWGWENSAELTDVIELITDQIEGLQDDPAMFACMGSIFMSIGGMPHVGIAGSGATNVDLVADIYDSNDNGDTTDLIPDWDNAYNRESFPAPDHALENYLEVNLPGTGDAQAVIGLVMGEYNGYGLIPLGMNVYNNLCADAPNMLGIRYNSDIRINGYMPVAIRVALILTSTVSMIPEMPQPGVLRYQLYELPENGGALDASASWPTVSASSVTRQADSLVLEAPLVVGAVRRVVVPVQDASLDAPIHWNIFWSHATTPITLTPPGNYSLTPGVQSGDTYIETLLLKDEYDDYDNMLEFNEYGLFNLGRYLRSFAAARLD